MPKVKTPVPVVLILIAAPVLLIGATLWMVNDLVPVCSLNEVQRHTAPDNRFDLVTFTRTCGETTENMQAVLVPPGELVPYDAESFVSVAAAADLDPRWDAYGNIEITLPPDAEIVRQDDTVAGISVIYR